MEENLEKRKALEVAMSQIEKQFFFFQKRFGMGRYSFL